MCYHFQSSDMLEWLKTQVRVIEAWREDVASRPDLDMEMITRLEHHWLFGLGRLPLNSKALYKAERTNKAR